MSPSETDRLAVLLAALKLCWPHIASFTGAVISLSFIERLTNRGRCVAVAVGVLAASFLGPITHQVALHYAPFLTADVVAPGLNFLVALTFMAALPGLMRYVAAKSNDAAWIDALIKKANPL